MIVIDTGAAIALIDSGDRHHRRLRAAFEESLGEWVLPWAVLPEVDHLARTRLGRSAALAFRDDVASGAFAVEWDGSVDLVRARAIETKYADLELGFVDSVVMAMAERLEARAIATLDLRDFAPVELAGRPQLWPRDLPERPRE